MRDDLVSLPVKLEADGEVALGHEDEEAIFARRARIDFTSSFRNANSLKASLILLSNPFL